MNLTFTGQTNYRVILICVVIMFMIVSGKDFLVPMKIKSCLIITTNIINNLKKGSIVFSLS